MKEKTYKVVWWNDMEQEYTESILGIEGVDFLVQCVGTESIFSIE